MIRARRLGNKFGINLG
jgi:hypothetical protein